MINLKSRLPGRLLPRAFFEEPPEEVAPRLLGMVLVRISAAGVMAGRIVEVEAYLGPHHDPPDPAAHSHHGPTERNRVLFGPPAHAYVYSIYGLHFCLNVACEMEGKAGGVLLRALEPMIGQEEMRRNRGLAPGASAKQIASGPGRLCQALGVTRQSHNGLDLLDAASPLQLRCDDSTIPEMRVTCRIGIREAVDWPLRFLLFGHPCVSTDRAVRSPSLLRKVKKH